MGALEILFIIMIIIMIITIITIMIIISEQGCNSATGWWPVLTGPGCWALYSFQQLVVPVLSCGDTDSGRGILHCPTTVPL